MPHDPGSPASWLRFARSDLALARQQPGGDVLAEAVVTWAQESLSGG